MRTFPRLLLVPALLLALFSCKKEVLVPVIERGADVAIPQEGGTYSVPVTYQATKAVEYGSFRYRLNIEHQLGPLMEVTGKVKVYPGIGLSCWPDDGENLRRLGEHIEIVRKLGLSGFTVFALGSRSLAAFPAFR